jgi:hypothetical protein
MALIARNSGENLCTLYNCQKSDSWDQTRRPDRQHRPSQRVFNDKQEMEIARYIRESHLSQHIPPLQCRPCTQSFWICIRNADKEL